MVVEDCQEFGAVPRFWLPDNFPLGSDFSRQSVGGTSRTGFWTSAVMHQPIDSSDQSIVCAPKPTNESEDNQRTFGGHFSFQLDSPPPPNWVLFYIVSLRPSLTNLWLCVSPIPSHCSSTAAQLIWAECDRSHSSHHDLDERRAFASSSSRESLDRPTHRKRVLCR